MAKRKADLLWGNGKRTTKGPKPALDIKRIVAEAIAIADANGLSALSMNALATRLGVGTMSLYRYVASKDELLELMLDEAIGPPPSFPAADTWRHSLLRWTELSLDIYDRHPWVLQAVATPRRMGPNELAWSEVGFAAATQAGARPEELFDIVMMISSYVRGAAQFSAKPGHGPRLDLDAMTRSGSLERFPALVSVVRLAGDASTYDGQPRRQFEFGLERLLDGIEHYLKSRK